MVKNDLEWLEMYGVNLSTTLFTLQFNSSWSNFLLLFKSYINFHICHYDIGVKMNTLTLKWSYFLHLFRVTLTPVKVTPVTGVTLILMLE